MREIVGLVMLCVSMGLVIAVTTDLIAHEVAKSVSILLAGFLLLEGLRLLIHNF